MVRDAAGNLYGTSRFGGYPSRACAMGDVSFGCGVVFKVRVSSTDTVLHNFAGGDGFQPYASLIRDAAGNLYGTTAFGGDTRCQLPSGSGCGVVFRVAP